MALNDDSGDKSYGAPEVFVREINLEGETKARGEEYSFLTILRVL